MRIPSLAGTATSSGGQLLFAHAYEPPRGRQGAPLAALPIWFPVAAYPVEVMTARQVFFRSIASVREPFRRSRLVLGDEAEARLAWDDLLHRSVSAVEQSWGASVVPITLSLARLEAASDELRTLAQAVEDAESEPSDDRRLAALLAAACRRTLELGTALDPNRVEALVAAVVAGNAVLFVQDDRHGGDDLAAVRKAFDRTFGKDGLSHVAIILVTSRRDCRILSDMQGFSVFRGRPRGDDRRPPRVSRLHAALCAAVAFWGSAPMRFALPLTGLFFVALIGLTVWLHDGVVDRGSVAMLAAVGIFTAALFVVGYVWALFPGSEEIRHSSVETMIVGSIGLLLFLLILLPRGFDPGALRSSLVALAAVPGAAVTGLALVTATGLVANIVWLHSSLSISKRIGADGLEALAQDFALELHVARHGVAVELPTSRSGAPKLPLLLCSRNKRLAADALRSFPQLGVPFRELLVEGLRKESEGPDISSSSLLLEVLREDRDAASRRVLEVVAEDLINGWHRRDEEFGTWRQPSTTFEMNSAEYAARQLCYLTDLDEVVVIR